MDSENTQSRQPQEKTNPKPKDEKKRDISGLKVYIPNRFDSEAYEKMTADELKFHILRKPAKKYVQLLIIGVKDHKLALEVTLKNVNTMNCKSIDKKTLKPLKEKNKEIFVKSIRENNS